MQMYIPGAHGAHRSMTAVALPVNGEEAARPRSLHVPEESTDADAPVAEEGPGEQRRCDGPGDPGEDCVAAVIAGRSWGFPVLNCTFAARLRAPRAARVCVAAAFSAYLEPVLLGDVELVVSELVTNAVTAQREVGYVRLTVRRIKPGLLVAASDQAGGLPCRAGDGDLAPGGRGLLLVEQLSRAWGWQAFPGGKTVWSVLAQPGVEDAQAARVDLGGPNGWLLR
jgi:anti-sigma regulatory factor (Ser/Thr protein kinase)